MSVYVNQKTVFNNLKNELNKYQKSRHFPEDEEKGADHPGNEVLTVFFSQYKRATWYYRYPEVMKKIKVENDEEDGEEYYIYKYKSNPHPHGLIDSDITMKIPSIVCQEGYEARWIHNIGSNIAIESSLYFNEIKIQNFDSVWTDIYGQTLSKEDPEVRSINLGNIDQLQNWNNVLPKFVTSCRLPWFYNESFSSYFPLYFCGLLDRVTHVIKVRRNINQLLEVRSIDDGQIQEVSDITIKYINRKPFKTLLLPSPEMYGDYLYLSDLECAYNRCVNSSDSRNVIYVNDVIKMDSSEMLDEKKGSRNSVIFKINDTGYPVHFLSWVARSEGAFETHQYSNYSTSPNDYREGWSPFKSSTLKIGKGLTFKDLPSYRTERVYPQRYLPSTPKEPGYNSWSLGVKAGENNPQPGVVIKNGYLRVNMEEQDPYIGTPYESQEPNSSYIVELRMLYTKRIIFSDYPKDENERTNKRATLEIQGAEI